jgi:hypothetical protein
MWGNAVSFSNIGEQAANDVIPGPRQQARPGDKRYALARGMTEE